MDGVQAYVSDMTLVEFDDVCANCELMDEYYTHELCNKCHWDSTLQRRIPTGYVPMGCFWVKDEKRYEDSLQDMLQADNSH